MRSYKFYARFINKEDGGTIVIVGDPEDEEIGCGSAVGNQSALFAFLKALGTAILMAEQMEMFWDMLYELKEQN